MGQHAADSCLEHAWLSQESPNLIFDNIADWCWQQERSSPVLPDQTNAWHCQIQDACSRAASSWSAARQSIGACFRMPAVQQHQRPDTMDGLKNDQESANGMVKHTLLCAVLTGKTSTFAPLASTAQGSSAKHMKKQCCASTQPHESMKH